MNANKRRRNERKFPHWEELPDGGRRYVRIRRGDYSGEVRYIKEVDSEENMLRVYQEVYDELGELIGFHQKFPEDTGHQFIRRR